MPRTILEDLLRKNVEIRANGFLYRGILMEVAEKEITLRGPTGFISIPMDRVTSIRDPNAKAKNPTPRFVDPSFYDTE